MITEQGYSKDPNIVPDGIVVTFGKDMMLEQGGVREFLKYFHWCMEQEITWMHKCKNRPQHDINYVYVIALNRLYCRCYFGGYETTNTTGWTADDQEKVIDWPRIILAGPIERAPFRRELKGFQGFRYSTKLF